MKLSYQLFCSMLMFLCLFARIQSESVSFAERLGRATGIGLGKTITHFVKQPIKKQKPPLDRESKFILAAYEGKIVPIPHNINAVRTVKLYKNPFNTTALMAATLSGRTEIVTYLLEHDADPDSANRDGLTALHLAARNGDTRLVKILLDFGADPDTQDKHLMTPLMYAVMRNSNNDHYKIIKKLLAAGADPNLKNNKEQTALMMAVRNNDYDVTRLLLDYDADISLQDAQGTTVFDFARADSIKNLLMRSLESELAEEEQEEFYPVFGYPYENL
jgi:ankyrin repeat protein